MSTQASIQWDLVSAEEIALWQEISDSTEREPGKSSAALMLREEKAGQRTILLAHLDPQPNGAAFVSFARPVVLELTCDSTLRFTLGSLAEPFQAQLVLTTETSQATGFQYQASFTVPENITEVTLHAQDFVAQKWGAPVDDAPAVFESPVVQLGVRIVGRPSPSVRQQGFYGARLLSLSAEF